ncbi:leucine-rich repeat protein 1-like [Anneissia japonica]|uniref:leucine-rich repeat protein 1-like n=1 Tax=Anneissia japonica TaxID=1529436 RepID=UPI00142582D6|nr:leucine-rich repeat protein 1-like [Anneissia japonica]XP_033127783.1 leucine-rich repeat protein 1-like [Anneissia japonica]
MRLTCNAEVVNRQLSSQGMSKKVRPVRSFLSIGRSKSTDSKTGAVFLLLCTAKDRVGTKYKLRENVQNVFTKFVQEGKATIRLNTPAFDIHLQKADPTALKNFLSVVKLGHQNKELDKSNLSTLAPATISQVEPLKVRLNITNRQNYPLAAGFPKTLETLRVCNCMLKKVDPRILSLKKLRSLDLSDNRFQTLPPELGEILTLAELKVTGNYLKEVPKCVWTGNLRCSLRMLDISNNELQYISPDLARVSSLVRLNIDSNQVERLPTNFGELTSLKFFSAAKNKLKKLPATFGYLNMEQLDLSANEFEKIADDTKLNQDYAVMPLVELAARIVAKFRLPHDPSTLPAYLCDYLTRAKVCVCSRVCFIPYATALLTLDLRRTAHTIVRTGNAGITAPLETFLCSTLCYRNLQKNAKALWKCKR